MPRSRRIKSQNLSNKQKENYFIGVYIKEGAVDEKIPYAERRASLKPGIGRRILNRKDVQAKIKVAMEPVCLEQIRQQLVSAAVAQVTAKLREEKESLERELKAIKSLARVNFGTETLEHELMRLVVGLNQDKYPKLKLEAIKAAFVAGGFLQVKESQWLSRHWKSLLGAKSSSLEDGPPTSIQTNQVEK
jgi:hypothetical protein